MVLGSHWQANFERYGAAWVRAGGAFDEIVPVSPASAPGNGLDCDGVLLTGGADVEPWRYGEAPAAGVELDTSGERDELDLAVLARADAHRWPLLGICRGLQILNVHRGGSLYQDLDTAGLPGHRVESPRDALAHAVRLEPATRWLAHLPGEFLANTRHHQAVQRPGRGLRVVANAPDELIEAVEGEEEDRFLVAVQWHPEDIVGGAHEAVFRAFRDACAGFAARRGGR
jgi:putative glutamine amidotransferase